MTTFVQHCCSEMRAGNTEHSRSMRCLFPYNTVALKYGQRHVSKAETGSDRLSSRCLDCQILPYSLRTAKSARNKNMPGSLPYLSDQIESPIHTEYRRGERQRMSVTDGARDTAATQQNRVAQQLRQPGGRVDVAGPKLPTIAMTCVIRHCCFEVRAGQRSTRDPYAVRVCLNATLWL